MFEYVATGGVLLMETYLVYSVNQNLSFDQRYMLDLILNLCFMSALTKFTLICGILGSTLIVHCVPSEDMWHCTRVCLIFTEHVTLYKKPKPDFKDLVPTFVPYKPTYVGNVLFNGKLVKANANYGCFMTLNSANHGTCNIPDNLRVSAVIIRSGCKESAMLIFFGPRCRE